MKKVQFFIDDVIWLMRDLTRQKPSSMFDNPFLGALKKAHDNYGVKTQLNLFYRTSFFYGDDDFSLKDMTDAYKSEWESASDWLKLAFHSKEEFPDYPYVNASYDLVKSNYEQITNEIKRFAGEKSIAVGIVPHWAPISFDGVRALKDCGATVTYATYGDTFVSDDTSYLPYGHDVRYIMNKKPETMFFRRHEREGGAENAICSYNHITNEQFDSINDNMKLVKDEKTGMYFNNACHIILNLCSLEELPRILAEFSENEYINIGNHEQYFYPDYFNYQPDYAEKIYTMGKVLSEAGYEFIFMEDMVDYQ